MSAITKEQFEKYNEILEREKNRGLRSYMSGTIAVLSTGLLKKSEVIEITKNYSTYEKQYANGDLPTQTQPGFSKRV
jgi:hypothetical protein